MKNVAITMYMLAVSLLLAVSVPASANASTPPPALLAPGVAAPDFALQDLSGHRHALSDYLAEGKVVVLEWFNPDCPFVKKHHEHHRTMAELFARFKPHGIVWLAINSGAPGLEGHGLKRNRRAHEKYSMQYPVLLDPTGRVGKQYGARTTPHMFIITPDGKIAYNGAIDNERAIHQLGTVNHVKEALEAIVTGKPVAVAETQPYGCSVKYAN